jgi:C-terminal processing protease CtpA/Prc
MLKYLSYPTDDKALRYIVRTFDLLRSHTSEMEIGILRNGENLTLTVTGFEWNNFAFSLLPQPSFSHEILENNIGLINLAMLEQSSIRQIMQEFADTDGLIIDLRQYPSWFVTYELAEYLVPESMLFSIISKPSQSVPGMFIDKFWGYSGGMSSPDAYFYDRPVVILMNEWTQSQAEFTIMSLRNGPNVTVIGTNSIGADGNVTILPLPGGINMWYTGFGVYTPEGGQTQRIGLPPDIYADRTIEGITEGRDELMEAAIRYIMGNTR